MSAGHEAKHLPALRTSGKLHPVHQMTKLLIDADYFFYRAASSEKEHEYNEELTVIVGDFNEGKRIVRNEFKKLTSRFDTEDIVLFFTDRKNFRKTVDPEYKGNRVKRKPCGYLKLKNWGMETYPSVSPAKPRGRRCLGIYATKGDIRDFVLDFTGQRHGTDPLPYLRP